MIEKLIIFALLVIPLLEAKKTCKEKIMSKYPKAKCVGKSIIQFKISPQNGHKSYILGVFLTPEVPLASVGLKNKTKD